MISPYIAEFVGTTILLLLGSGIVANVSLSKTKGSKETPLITITTAWGFAVFVAAYVTGEFSGAHLNHQKHKQQQILRNPMQLL